MPIADDFCTYGPRDWFLESLFGPPKSITPEPPSYFTRAERVANLRLMGVEIVENKDDGLVSSAPFYDGLCPRCGSGDPDRLLGVLGDLRNPDVAMVQRAVRGR